MTKLNRRRFLELESVAGALGVTAPGFVIGATQRKSDDAAQDADDRVVRLSGTVSV